MTTSPHKPSMPNASLPHEFSLLRIVAHGLVPATTHQTPWDVVSHQGAMQGQQVSATPAAVFIRGTGFSPSDVVDAFATGKLVTTWFMRGTIHVASANDYRWMHFLWQQRDTRWINNVMADMPGPMSHLDLLAQQCLTSIATNGPLNRRSFKNIIHDHHIVDDVPADHQGRAMRTLLHVLHHQGVLVSGPQSGNEHLLMDTTSLPDFPAHLTEKDCEGELARRYILSHGPVSAVDFARWTGYTKTRALSAIHQAYEMSRDDPRNGTDWVPLSCIGIDRNTTVDISHPPTKESGDTYYMRADLRDLLNKHRQEAMRTIFLPAFDELYIGYRDRTCLTDAAGERLICPTRNASLKPFLVDRGKLVGVWPRSASSPVWIDTHGQPTETAPSQRLKRDAFEAYHRIQET